jgi:hypothetical protein
VKSATERLRLLKPTVFEGCVREEGDKPGGRCYFVPEEAGDDRRRVDKRGVQGDRKKQGTRPAHLPLT